MQLIERREIIGCYTRMQEM